jgi:pantetheine-phosphate adenylyltransferase
MTMKAIYPGSFDPITNGHIDIIRRGLDIFDKIIVSVLENPIKNPLFPAVRRVEMIRQIFKHEKKVEVKSFQGLLVEFARRNKARIVIRGLRAISDFEYEFQMALMNRNLAPDVETFFMMPSLTSTFLSSKLVKEVFALGGPVRDLVPPAVEKALSEKYREDRESFFVNQRQG